MSKSPIPYYVIGIGDNSNHFSRLDRSAWRRSPNQPFQGQNNPFKVRSTLSRLNGSAWQRSPNRSSQGLPGKTILGDATFRETGIPTNKGTKPFAYPFPHQPRGYINHSPTLKYRSVYVTKLSSKEVSRVIGVCLKHTPGHPSIPSPSSKTLHRSGYLDLCSARTSEATSRPTRPHHRSEVGKWADDS